MSEHAPLAPSAAHRWMRCPGSVAQIGGRESPDSEHSREGTFAHSLAAQCLSAGVPARTLIGQTNLEFTCDAEMARHIQTYLDLVDMCVLTEDGTLLVEKRVFVIDETVYGTGDAIVITPTVLHVWDFKFGAGVLVDALGNEQLRLYGLGALMTPSVDVPDTVTHVHLHIVQPRRPDWDGEIHRTEILTVEELREFFLEVEAAVAATRVANAPLVPGDHCHFCVAKPDCPALRQQAMQIAQDVFPALDPLQPVLPPAPSSLTPAQLSRILDGATVVEQWIDAVRGHALDRAQRGEVLPNHKLVEKFGHRKWTDEVAAAGKLKAAGVQDPYEHSLLSPAQIEKKSKSLKPLVATLTVKPSIGFKLVRDDNPAPAIERGVPFTPLD